MSERTTLAEILSQIFAKLEEGMPAQQNNGTTLLNAWTSVLGGSDRTPLDVVAAIGQVSSALIKLEAQVQASNRLKGAQKRSALQTINGFKGLFEVRRFHVPVSEFRNLCSETNRGNLGIIGHSLELEFSEPQLEKSDADQIVSGLKEVREMLNNSSISIDLRLSLIKHVDAMIWWLSHPEMASLQDIFETAGAAMVVAKQMTDRDERGAGKEASTTKKIFERICVIGMQLGKLVGLVTRGVEAADKLSGGVHHLIENLNPPT